MDGNPGVPQHGFRAGSRHRDGAGDGVGAGIGQGIADEIQLVVLLLVADLQVGQCGGAAGAPVDNPFVAVNSSLVVEVDEGGAHRLAGARVQGETVAVPVGGDTQPAGLLMDNATNLPDVLPDQLHELFPAQLMPVLTLGSQLPFHRPLGGDAGMVGARQPEGRRAAHAAPADQGILQRFLQGVSQVQLAGDVGGRHDYAVGSLVRVWRRCEETLVQPILINALLNVGGVISPGHVCGGSGSHSRSLPAGE